MLHVIHRMLQTFGIDLHKMATSLADVPAYLRDLQAFRKQSVGASAVFPMARPYPCLSERHQSSGFIASHYFHQDLLIAQRIFDNRPVRHIDVGSRVDGLVTHVASFRPLEVMDIRPLPQTIRNVTYLQADLMAPLPDSLKECCDSLSCLHVAEHFGLGRYGDPINPDGHLLGMRNLHQILKAQGTLYFSVPIGQQRIEFNAHRVFGVAYLLQCFADQYRLERFAFVDDAGRLHENADLSSNNVARNFDCRFGCGILELTKLR